MGVDGHASIPCSTGSRIWRLQPDVVLAFDGRGTRYNVGELTFAFTQDVGNCLSLRGEVFVAKEIRWFYSTAGLEDIYFTIAPAELHNDISFIGIFARD